MNNDMKQAMKAIIAAEAAKRPFAEPTDIVKLIYQSVFGNAHMINDEKAAFGRLKKEAETLAPRDDICHCESLGASVRINLSADGKVLSDGSLRLLARLFCLSAKRFPSGYESADEDKQQEFLDALDIAAGMASDGALPFSAGEFSDYISKYREMGFPAVSHSDRYREAYRPAYRVVDTRLARIFPLVCMVDELMKNSGRPFVLAIDGRAASGKTTAAADIAEFFGDTEIVHMDDFFLPGELRTKERLSEAGGNLHRERFSDEVVSHIRGGGFDYRVFDCGTFDYKKEPRHIGECSLIICEGAYSLHPAFGKYYDLAAFSDISAEEQHSRILSRNGEKMLGRFENVWIPMEEEYFLTFGIRGKCDITI